MADYNEMFQTAVELYEKQEYAEAATIFYDVAIATGDKNACSSAISIQLLLAWADLDWAKSVMHAGACDLDAVNKAISLLNFVNDNSIEIDREKEENWIKQACKIKGIILFILSDPECEKWLTWAEEYGDNQSRYWHIHHLVKVIKTASDDESIEIIERIKVLGEEYVKNYVPDDADSDELRSICNLLVSLFENEDSEKLSKYSRMAELFDEETKTVKSAPESEPAKKKGIFGFRK